MSISRRQALTGLGTVSLGTLLAACSEDDRGGDGTRTAETTAARRRPDGTLAELFDETSACTLSPELTEGPFYFDVDAIRSDIREDRQGVKLRLAIRVRNAESCEPLRNAVVDIWHCDATGVYSGFESGDDETFLRGAQVTNADGIVEFVTIYPGAYQGRTVHIHAKVHLDKQTVLTTQFFFADRTTSAVVRNKPYSAGDTDNGSDGIFDEALVLDTRAEAGGYLGLISIDVDRA